MTGGEEGAQRKRPRPSANADAATDVEDTMPPAGTSFADATPAPRPPPAAGITGVITVPSTPPCVANVTGGSTLVPAPTIDGIVAPPHTEQPRTEVFLDADVHAVAATPPDGGGTMTA